MNIAAPFFILYNDAGILLGVQQTPWPTLPDTHVLQVDTATFENILDVAQNPTHYTIVNNQIVPLPHWRATSTVSAGTALVTATLFNPSSSLPSGMTVAVGATQALVPLSGTTGTVQIQLHESLAHTQIPLTIQASGTIGTSVMVGHGPTAPIAAQLISPPFRRRSLHDCARRPR